MARNVIYDKGGVASTIDGLLKEHYVIQQIQDTVNMSTELLKRLKSEKTTAGRQFIIPVRFGVSQGVGSRAENVQLPDPGFGVYEQASGNVKYLYGQLYITGQSIAATRGNKASFAEVLKQALRDAREGLKLDVQRQVWGDGTGAIAEVGAAVAASTTVPVNNPYSLTYAAALSNSEKTRLFRKYMKLYIDSTTDVAATVATVNNDGTITTTAAISADAGAVIYRGDSTTLAQTSVNNDITGLSAIVSSTGTYLGIPRADFLEWQGNVINNAGAISEDAMRQVVDTLLVNGDGSAEPDLIITDYKTRRKYETLLQSQKRFVNPMTLEGGSKVLEFDGMPLVVDKDAPPERMWFLHTPDIMWMVMEDFNWMDRDGAVLSRVQSFDAYVATLLGYKELICKKPANQAVLFGIV